MSQLPLRNEKHYAALCAMYLLAPNNEYYKPVISIEKSKAQISIDVLPKMFHTAGALHGSVYFKLLDDAAFFSANSLVKDVFLLTVNFNLQIIRMVTKGKLTAYGEVVSRSNQIIHADAKILNEKGKLIAKANGGFMKSQMQLSSVNGYKDFV